MLESYFSISWLAALPVVLMFVCAWFKIPAIPTLFINIFVSTGIIFLHQPHVALTELATLMEQGFVSQTHNKAVDALLTRGGIANMMGTVSLIVTTLALGGLLMELGIIQTAMEPLIKRLKKPGNLVLATVLSGIGVNLFVGEQYLSVILPEACAPIITRFIISPPTHFSAIHSAIGHNVFLVRLCGHGFELRG